jgi:hypothetical protein
MTATGRPIRRVVDGFSDLSRILLDAQELEENTYAPMEEIEEMFMADDWTEEDIEKYLAQKRASA